MYKQVGNVSSIRESEVEEQMNWLQVFQVKRDQLQQECRRYREWEQDERDPMLRRAYIELARVTQRDIDAIDDAVQYWYDYAEQCMSSDTIRLEVACRLQHIPTPAHKMLTDILRRDAVSEYMRLTTNLSMLYRPCYCTPAHTMP
jgi:hypothetical protein